MWGIETLLSTLAGGISLLVLFRRIQSTRPSLVPKSVALVVLGDIGRSPRMMYHAESLARNGYTTHIVAYRGAFASIEPHEAVLTSLSHAHPDELARSQGLRRRNTSQRTRTSASSTSRPRSAGLPAFLARSSSSASRSRSSSAPGTSCVRSSRSRLLRLSSLFRCASQSKLDRLPR